MVYSLYVSVFVGLKRSSYFGYLLFFVYVGALLVMFCIVVRLAPNPVFRVVPFMGLLPFCLSGGCWWLGVGSLGVSSLRVNGELFGGLGVYDGIG